MAAITLIEPYQSRPIRFLDQIDHDGWRVKRYGISAHDEYPSEALVTAGTEEATARLPLPPITDDRYGVAVLIVHEARGGNFISLNWWVNENILKNFVFLSQPDTPTAFKDVSETGITACVWELRVLSFEREAWIETVLANTDSPDIEAYLARQLTEDV